MKSRSSRVERAIHIRSTGICLASSDARRRLHTHRSLPETTALAVCAVECVHILALSDVPRTTIQAGERVVLAVRGGTTSAHSLRPRSLSNGLLDSHLIATVSSSGRTRYSRLREISTVESSLSLLVCGRSYDVDVTTTRWVVSISDPSGVQSIRFTIAILGVVSTVWNSPPARASYGGFQEKDGGAVGRESFDSRFVFAHTAFV